MNWREGCGGKRDKQRGDRLEVAESEEMLGDKKEFWQSRQSVVRKKGCDRMTYGCWRMRPVRRLIHLMFLGANTAGNDRL